MRSALLFSFCLLLVVGCNRSQGDAPGNPDEAAAQDFTKIIAVEVTTLSPTPFEDFIRLTGVVKADQDVILSADEGGRIERFYVEKGQRVKRSQSLVQIDDRILKAAVAEAEADSTLAAEQFNRQSRVWKEEQIGSEMNYVKAQQDAAGASARLQGLRARLDNTVIRAPFDGVLDQRYFEKGEMAPLGSRVVRVLNTETLKVECGVPERFAADVRKGSRTALTFDVLPAREFVARVSFVGRAVDPGNRTFPIEIKLENPESFVKPEMIANVRVTRTRLESAIVVPQEALNRTETGYVAFVATDGPGGPIAEERHVIPGPSYSNQVVIEQGLANGDRLITRGHTLVASGSRVQIVNEPEASPRNPAPGSGEGTKP
jgi:membrane fusion protein (multidrug efflux system)